MEIVKSKDFARNWMVWQKNRHEHPELFKMISSGLLTLDDRLGGGIEKGQLMYLGGSQKSGKTTVLKYMAQAAGKQGLKFIWFGAEMNNLQTGSLVFSNISGIDRTRIRNPNGVLTIADWAKLEAAAAEIEKYEGYWSYGFSTLADIHNAISAIELEGEDIDLIFGDYVQLMEQPGFRDAQLELKYISRGLKRLTISHTHAKTGEPKLIAVVFAAQFNRASQQQKQFTATSFLGSGSLERDGDIALGVQSVVDPLTQLESETVKEILFLAGREIKNGKPLQIGYNGSTASVYDLPASRMVDPNSAYGTQWR